MARSKRNQESIKRRTAEKRKQEDDLLRSGSFQDVGELSADVNTEVYSAGRKKHRSSWDSEEQDYELQPRKLQDAEEDMVEGLPIKINGKVARNLVKRQSKKSETEKKEEEESEESEEEGSEKEEPIEEEKEEEEEPENILVHYGIVPLQF